MTFKHNWEKAHEQHRLPTGIIKKMLAFVYPDKELLSHELIAGGCANLNIKVSLEDNEQPLLLRIYLRDKDAAYREQKLGVLLKQKVPVPIIYYVGKCDVYHFAITNYIPGRTLSDLLLSNIPHDVGVIMYEVGILLAKISENKFHQAGLFDKF